MLPEEYRATSTSPYHITCGAAVYRWKDGVREYALLYRGERFGAKGNSWHLPKGTLAVGETLEACALREISEESGLTVELEVYLGAVKDAWTNEAGLYTDKTAHYFLARDLGGEYGPIDHEHDRLDWFPAAVAMEKLRLMPKQEEEIIRRAELSS